MSDTNLGPFAPENVFGDLLHMANNGGGFTGGSSIIYDGNGVASAVAISATGLTVNGVALPLAPGATGQYVTLNGTQLQFTTLPASGATTLAGDTDVTLTSPTNGQYLKFNGSNWVNSTFTLSGNISSLTNDANYITLAAVAGVGYLTVQGDLTGPITSTGLVTSVASQTGTGTKFVMDTSPTLVTPILGIAVATTINKITFTTPATGATLTIQDGFTLTVSGSSSVNGTFSGTSSGTNTGDQTSVSGSSGSCTGNSGTATLASTVTTNANLTGVITSSGNATSIASQTGTGTKFVTDTTPTLVTPVLGIATATSINKLTITQPAAGAILTINDGKTLTVSNTADVSGTNTGDQLVFKTISVAGQTDVVADSITDTLTIAAGANVTITTNATTDTITIAASGSGGIGDADYGDVTISSSGTVFTVDSVTVADAAGDSTTWPMLARSVTGTGQVVSTDPGITYDATANSLATTTFVGAFTGNVTGNTSGSSGSCTGNAATATKLAATKNIGGVAFDGSADITPANITAVNEATDTTCFPAFFTAATGNLPPSTNTAYTFNSNAVNLSCTTFTGNLTGNVTGNCSGSSGTCTGTTPVTTGGTGLTTLTTAYAPICSGTTATGNLQIANTGQSTSGWVWTSTGASSLPTFQAAAGGTSLGVVVALAAQQFCA